MGDDRWLGKAAVLWAMDDAPDVPARLASTLTAVARYADEDGRGSYPSASTVAAITRKSESQAKRDMAELEKLGLLLLGDQRLVKDIRADRRPKVYDLPMPRGVAQDTPPGSRGASRRPPYGAHLDGPRDGQRGAYGDSTGRIPLQNGVRPDAPEQILKGSRRRARGAAGADAAPRTQPKPLWCGECDERTRQIGDPPRRCPDCHPLAGQEPRGRHARTGDGAALAVIAAGVAERRDERKSSP